jgi:hypothetical protein
MRGIYEVRHWDALKGNGKHNRSHKDFYSHSKLLRELKDFIDHIQSRIFSGISSLSAGPTPNILLYQECQLDQTRTYFCIWCAYWTRPEHTSVSGVPTRPDPNILLYLVCLLDQIRTYFCIWCAYWTRPEYTSVSGVLTGPDTNILLYLVWKCKLLRKHQHGTVYHSAMWTNLLVTRLPWPVRRRSRSWCWKNLRITLYRDNLHGGALYMQ